MPIDNHAVRCDACSEYKLKPVCYPGFLIFFFILQYFCSSALIIVVILKHFQLVLPINYLGTFEPQAYFPTSTSSTTSRQLQNDPPQHHLLQDLPGR